jgi:hypothetical protein
VTADNRDKAMPAFVLNTNVCVRHKGSLGGSIIFGHLSMLNMCPCVLYNEAGSNTDYENQQNSHEIPKPKQLYSISFTSIMAKKLMTLSVYHLKTVGPSHLNKYASRFLTHLTCYGILQYPANIARSMVPLPMAYEAKAAKHTSIQASI